VRFLLVVFLNFSAMLTAQSQDSIVNSVTVRGNMRVETEAVLTIITSKVKEAFSEERIKDDIIKLFELGYFADIRVYRKNLETGIELIYEVKEKPAIIAIEYEGFENVKKEDLEKKLETKIYTIVNEDTIKNDLEIITKEYAEKGYYFASVDYTLVEESPNETKLVYKAVEGDIVKVADVKILGNAYFSDVQLVNLLALKPADRISAYSSMASLYRDDFLKRDTEFLSYYYRDNGFMEVKVAKPIVIMDKARDFVRVNFELEEGLQFQVGTIDIVGDMLYPKEELMELMQLKTGDLFRLSRFQKDVDMLVDKYGDKGYAFADVNPKTQYNRETTPPTIDLVYEIAKGEKVYLGDFYFVGNTKTRDNVLRRELDVTDASLYSGTRLRETKRNIERLGYFDEIQMIRERDEEDPSLLHYKIKIKEKPTGQLQAAIGYQPGQSKVEQQWFFQGKYNEENQSGYGWKTSVAGRWNGGRNYSLDVGFTNPRVNDTQWSLGLNGFLQNTVRSITTDVDIQERRIGTSVTIGRRIIELIRASISYSISKITTTSDSYIIDRFREDGINSNVTFALSRNSTNNFIDPSEGSKLRVAQTYAGGLLGGDFEYQESAAEADYYFPIDFSDTFRTYFHLRGVTKHIYPLHDKAVPVNERYRLGGPNDLRGYDWSSVGPHFNIMRDPGGSVTRYNKGGDKQLFYQVEYFVPLIQEAGIKGLVFFDAGRVFDDDEPLSLSDFKRDYGFGFRWVTPLAPFRFEWAYPMDGEDGDDMKFVFSLGF
jgi:outer membrane protein insertion porin family